MRPFPFLAGISLAALALAPLAAADCDTITTPMTGGFFLVPIETPVDTFYVYYDAGCDPACHGPQLWVFEESNGERGLQYNDLWTHEGIRCAGLTEDTVVF